MLTTAELKSKLAKNVKALAEADKELQAQIDAANKLVSENKLSPDTKIKEALTKYRPYKQWCEALELLIKESEKKGSDLTDEETKIALCKARKFSSVRVKPDKTTHKYVKSFPNEEFDISAILKKLEIDTGFRYHITLLAVTLTYGVCKLLDIKNPEECFDTTAMKDTFRTRMQDEKVKEKLASGADLDSKSQAEKAFQDVINAFLPSANYKATKTDAIWFLLGSTSMDRKTLGGIKVASYKVIENMVYDAISLKLKNNGIAEYSVTYKTKSKKAEESVPEEKTTTPEAEKPETAAEEPAAPVEEKAAKEAKEPTKQEKPKRERKSKTGKKADEAAA